MITPIASTTIASAPLWDAVEHSLPSTWSMRRWQSPSKRPHAPVTYVEELAIPCANNETLKRIVSSHVSANHLAVPSGLVISNSVTLRTFELVLESANGIRNLRDHLDGTTIGTLDRVINARAVLWEKELLLKLEEALFRAALLPHRFAWLRTPERYFTNIGMVEVEARARTASMWGLSRTNYELRVALQQWDSQLTRTLKGDRARRVIDWLAQQALPFHDIAQARDSVTE
jgi:hypothetical protein